MVSNARWDTKLAPSRSTLNNFEGKTEVSIAKGGTVLNEN
jgi:hypothetical protein